MKNMINRPLFALQNRLNRKNFVLFSIVLAFFIALIIGLFPLIPSVIESMPEELAGMMNVATLGDYYNTEGFELLLIVVVFVAVIAINVTSSEFKNGSYELIYSLNVSRKSVMATKYLSVVVYSLLINLVSAIVGLVAMLIVGAGSFSVGNYFVYMLISLIISLQVATIVFSLGLINKGKGSMAISIVAVVVMYFFATLSMLADGLAWLGYLSPFTSITGTIMKDGFAGIASHGIILAIWTVISAVLAIFAYKKFQNDDLC